MSYPVTVPDWAIYGGDTFSQTYQIKDSTTGNPINLSAWGSWVATWRPYQGADVVTLTVTTSNLSTGFFTITASDTQTRFMDGPGMWDVQATNSSVVRTWLRGKTDFTAEVSP